MIASSNDFYSWISLADDLGKNRAQPESSTAIEALTALLGRAGIVPGLRRTGSGQAGTNLIVTQLVSNEIPASTERPQTCVEGQLCATALVSVTNVSPDQAASESLEIIDPRAPATGAAPARISFDVTVPARESLLLPVHAPLCSAASPERTLFRRSHRGRNGIAGSGT